ncbi:MAG: family 43 glycosylhydrolase [Clostridia bacterium]|nr:family 43 glycosylhydrolase [Clostridia bacterium]
MKTYCNPLCIEGVESGRPVDTHQMKEDIRSIKDYRSISDPSVIYHDGKWIMYPSYSVAYVTEDFVNWKHVDIGVHDVSYSPAIVEFRGKWYLNGHQSPDMYCADSPLGPFKHIGVLKDTKGSPIRAVDGCFLVHDDRLYIYWHSNVSNPENKDVYLMTGTVCAELDPANPCQMITEPVEINRFEPEITWQRFGENNENKRMGWIEGQWVFKIGNRIYLLYSGCGTQFSAYANGIMYSDEGPMGRFKHQQRPGPLTVKKHGLIRGAGHGSIAKGPNDTLWVFYTNIFCYNHLFERRVSMDPIGIDENGELYCPETTETPQFAPGILKNPEKGNSAGLVSLNSMIHPTASSCAPGRDAIYSCDENILSWWQPEESDERPQITYDFGKDTFFEIHSFRIIWRDIGMETADGIMPGPFQYIVEYMAKPNEWKILSDQSKNERDLCVDYRETDTVKALGIRLTITGAPKGITPGLVSFSAFGVCSCN